MFSKSEEKSVIKANLVKDKEPTANTLVSRATEIVGDIHFSGELIVEGRVKGTLITKGKVVIGKTGVIIGSLSCGYADIEGQVKGKILVSDTLSLRSSANVEGDVQTGKLAVEPGAIFNVNCQMKDAVKELKTEPKKPIEPSAKSGQSA